jgi:cytoskeletal protein CcmA (bactofilin family)
MARCKAQGAIHASRVVLYASAQVEGDIHSDQEGASFDGRSRKVSDPQEIAPQVTTHSSNGASNGAPVQIQPPLRQIQQPIQLS